MVEDDYLEEAFERTKRILESSEILCACYAYDYEKNGVMDSYVKFLALWKSFSYDEKHLVMSYFYSVNDNEMLKYLNKNTDVGVIHKLFIDFFGKQYCDLEELKEKVKTKF